ncbi:MAG TPA: Lsr2 family protein [Pseudonocardia sp.]
MAQKVTVSLVDDLDGSQASGTVEFALDGRSYAIDLSDENAQVLRGALAPYVEVARKSGGRGRGATGGTATPSNRRQDTAEIRTWAQENGHEVSDRGRIPAAVVDAYEARNNVTQVAEKPRSTSKKKAAPKVTTDPFATAS